MGHGLTLLFVTDQRRARRRAGHRRVGYDKYLRFAWPLLLILLVTSSLVIGIAATLE